MMTFQTAVLVAATFTSGLSAGLFYTFFFSVMRGLASTDDRTFVTAMQRINVKIINGWFGVAFSGAPLLALLAAVLAMTNVPDGRAWVLAAAFLSVLTVVVTLAANVPLNNGLMAAGEPDRITDLSGVRARFERPWVRWNTVRTTTQVAAFAGLIWALLLHGRAV
jgi:uncharacterized membrane protein